MVVEHCAIFRCGISNLSFLEAGYAVNYHNYLRFLSIAIIPLIRHHSGNGCYWLWMDLDSAHYANDTLTFLRQQGTSFILMDANSPLRRFAPADGRFLNRAQKGYLQQRMGGHFNPGTEAENQREGLANSPADDPLPLQHGQGAICSLCS